MGFLKSILSKIVKFFTGGSAEKVFNAVADLVPLALPIVQTIARLTPNRTDDEILSAFQNYGVAASIEQIRSTPADQRGYLLLQLATGVLSRRFPGVATNILNSAIQLAVTGVKAG